MTHAYHVTVAVSDIEKSKQFYDGMFEKLGWESHSEDNESKAYSNGQFDYWIIPAETTGHNRHNDGTGINHLAFRVETKESVDVFYSWLQESHATIDIEAKAYPEYSETYYAVFFFDPDGTRLEVVYK